MEPKWQLDASASICPLCARRFTMTMRRHHCRVCGRVVCNACSKNRIKSKRITGRAGAKVRVCDECWNMLAPSHMQRRSRSWRRSSLERAMGTNAMAAGMTSGDTPASTPAGTRRAGQTKSTSHAVPPRSERRRHHHKHHQHGGRDDYLRWDRLDLSGTTSVREQRIREIKAHKEAERAREVKARRRVCCCLSCRGDDEDLPPCRWDPDEFERMSSDPQEEPLGDVKKDESPRCVLFCAIA